MTISPKLNDMSKYCAIKMAATASYNAVPSMLTVAPMGVTNIVTRGSTWLRSSKQLMVTGRVAELKIKHADA